MHNTLSLYSVSVITSKEKIYNDKERLKRKFNFKSIQSQQSEYSKNGTGLSQQASTSQLMFCPTNHQIVFNVKQRSSMQSQKEITSSISDTRVEDNEQMNQIIMNKRLVLTPTHNNDSLTDFLDDEFNLSKYNNYLSKDEYLNSKGFNPFQTKKTVLSPTNNSRNEQSNKIRRLFIKPNQSEVQSIGLLNDEFIADKIKVIENPQCKFISEVRSINEEMRLLPIKKINSLNANCIVNIVSFIYDDYNALIDSFQWLRNKVQYSLMAIYGNLVSSFKQHYKTVLDIEEYSFETGRCVKGSQPYPLFDIVIKAKVILKPTNDKNYLLRYSYKDSHNDEYMQLFLIDIRNTRTYPVWFTNESEMFNNKKIWFSYPQYVHSVCYGDHIRFRVNLLSKGHIGRGSSYQWLPLLIGNKNLSKGLYEKHEQTSQIPFDRLRHCEIEHMVRLWQCERKIPQSYWTMKKTIKIIYSKHFNKIAIYYDNSKPHLFKITMIAESIGIIPKNQFIHSSIEVIKDTEPIEIECSCIGFLSIQYPNHNNQRHQIRKGTKVIIYIIDL